MKPVVTGAVDGPVALVLGFGARHHQPLVLVLWKLIPATLKWNSVSPVGVDAPRRYLDTKPKFARPVSGGSGSRPSEAR